MDVGICEQHAVTFAAGLATQGYKPVVAIYSTFLQRSYDQIVHDVCLQKLPVIFCLDRAGLVGEDGPTHHGAFDIAYLRHIPELVMMAPKDEAELQSMLATALDMGRPVAIRYPRGLGVGAKLSDQPQPLPVGEGELIREGKDVMVIALGSRVYPALESAAALEAEGLDVGVFNPRFIKPLPIEQILELAKSCPRFVIAEEHTRMGGFASAVLEGLADADALSGLTIRRVTLPDAFVEHGKQKELRAAVGVDKTGIMNAVRELCGCDK